MRDFLLNNRDCSDLAEFDKNLAQIMTTQLREIGQLSSLAQQAALMEQERGTGDPEGSSGSVASKPSDSVRRC